MKKQICLMAMLLSVSALAFSQNTLTVENFTLPQTGGSIPVQITLDEAGVYAAYQFGIETPEGIVYPVDEDGDVECTLGSGYDSSHNATVHWNSETGLLGVGVISMKSALFKATSLALDIPLAATTAEVGTQLELTVKDIIIIKQSGEKVSLDDVPFTITIGEPDDGRITLDETSTTIPDAAANVNVTVKRTIKANQWSSICLPFDMTETQVKDAFGDDVKLEEYIEHEMNDEATAMTVTFAVARLDIDGLMANNPYIIKTSKDIVEFSVDGVTIDPDEDNACAEYTNGKSGSRKVVYGTFQGTYHAQTVVPENSLFLNNNQFWYSDGQTEMKAFRAYFTFADVLASMEDANERISMNIEDDTTGISLIPVLTPTDDGHIYDLQGRRVAKPSRGLYIKGNKKVIIK